MIQWLSLITVTIAGPKNQRVGPLGLLHDLVLLDGTYILILKQPCCFLLLTSAHALRMRISNKILNLSTNLFFGKQFSFPSNLKSKRAAPKGIYQSTALTLFSLSQLAIDRNKSRSLQICVIEITWMSKGEIVCKMRCHSLRAHKSLR